MNPIRYLYEQDKRLPLFCLLAALVPSVVFWTVSDAFNLSGWSRFLFSLMAFVFLLVVVITSTAFKLKLRTVIHEREATIRQQSGYIERDRPVLERLKARNPIMFRFVQIWAVFNGLIIGWLMVQMADISYPTAFLVHLVLIVVLFYGTAYAAGFFVKWADEHKPQ